MIHINRSTHHRLSDLLFSSYREIRYGTCSLYSPENYTIKRIFTSHSYCQFHYAPFPSIFDTSIYQAHTLSMSFINSTFTRIYFHYYRRNIITVRLEVLVNSATSDTPILSFSTQSPGLPPVRHEARTSPRSHHHPLHIQISSRLHGITGTNTLQT